MNEELAMRLKTLLADIYACYFKAHGYHWNVEGKNFPQYHELYGDIYEELHGSIDGLAEHIRALGTYAPFKMSRFVELTRVPETDVDSSCEAMSADLLQALTVARMAVKDASESAEQSREFGIMDTLGQIDTMVTKWMWQLRVSVKD